MSEEKCVYTDYRGDVCGANREAHEHSTHLFQPSQIQIPISNDFIFGIKLEVTRDKGHYFDPPETVMINNCVYIRQDIIIKLIKDGFSGSKVSYKSE